MTDTVEALIVGGGLAGLALADRLHRAGTSFKLVEARSRLGGRILGHGEDGASFDLGPAWFWPGQPRLAALAKRFALPVFEQYAEGAALFEDRSGQCSRIEGYAPMQGSYRIDGGMGRLIDALAACLPSGCVMSDTPIDRLEQRGDMIEAHCKESLVIAARQVVLALPPRLAASRIAFSPALPEAATSEMRGVPTWMAGQAKILALYDEPHWRHDGLSGDGISHIGPMVEIHDASPLAGGPSALFGFVGVPPHIRLARRDEVLAAARAQLVRLFGSRLAKPRALLMQDWADERWTAIEADHTGPDHHPAYGRPSVLEGLWEGRLHFASSEMASGFGGYLEGALEAAEALRL